MRVIGIETSCDETGVAIYDDGQGILSHQIYSQAQMHHDYGGVVPELASRDHARKTIPLIKAVMDSAACRPGDIHGLAYTAGPGLVGALLVGSTIGRSLAYAWNIPAIPVHHMEGHLLSPMLGNDSPDFPFLAMLVSGGHTVIVEAKKIGRYRILGESVDDAVGEAFDKVAKLMGLGYPGGPALAKLAETGTLGRFKFPRPMTDRPGLSMSFSGLKTFAANTILANCRDEKTRADIAAAFQDAVCDTLAIKCRRAIERTGLKRIVIAGGVSANKKLREYLTGLAEKIGGEVYYPLPDFCTDNGAMIAYAGAQRLKSGQMTDLVIKVRPRWPMDQLDPVR